MIINLEDKSVICIIEYKDILKDIYLIKMFWYILNEDIMSRLDFEKVFYKW